MKKLLYILIPLLFIISCEDDFFDINDQDKNPPKLPDSEIFTFYLSFFSYQNIPNYGSTRAFSAACKALEQWTIYLDEYQDLQNVYSIALRLQPEHFSGDTWYWSISYNQMQFEIYLTWLSEERIFCEAYKIDPINNNKQKLLEGSYSSNFEDGIVYLLSKDTLQVNWELYDDSKELTVINEKLDGYLLVEVDSALAYYQTTIDNSGEEAEILLNLSDFSGSITAYILFNDYEPHCWDANLLDTECDTLKIEVY